MRSRHAGGHGCLGLECDGMPSRETIEEKLGRGRKATTMTTWRRRRPQISS